jgi:hypothetical protein
MTNVQSRLSDPLSCVVPSCCVSVAGGRAALSRKVISDVIFLSTPFARLTLQFGAWGLVISLSLVGVGLRVTV